MNRNLATALACLFLVGLFIACGGGGTTIVSAPSTAATPSDSSTVSASASPPQSTPALADRVGQPIEHGGVRLEVRNVSIGKVPLNSLGDQGTSEDDLLQVAIEIHNLSDSKKVDYRGWGSKYGFNFLAASLEDELGNSYKRINFGIATVVGQVTSSESIYPGKSIRDVLVFEVPISKAKFLTLRLPGDALDLRDASFELVVAVPGSAAPSDSQAVTSAAKEEAAPATPPEEVAASQPAAEPVAEPVQVTANDPAGDAPKASENTTPSGGEFREFKSANGTFAVFARFVGMDGDEKVMLKRKDSGKLITVPLQQLSESDREWISDRRGGKSQD